MIGINTNETSDGGCHAVPAKMRLRELIEGKTVILSANNLSVVFPGGKPGDPNRPGRFVNIGNIDVGEVMLKESLALPYAHGTEVSRNNKYLDVAADARIERQGIWDTEACGSGPEQSIGLELEVRWDAEGDDSHNVNGEWIDVINNGDHTISLSGWRLRDPSTRFYSFPNGSSIPSGKIMRVHIGSGTDKSLEKYWGLSAPIFTNTIDQGVYLIDPDNDIRAVFEYKCRVDCSSELEGKVSIHVNYDAEGDDRVNPNGEWVKLTNLTNETIDLYGYLLDSYYQFEPEHHIKPNGSIKIHVGQGIDTETKLYRGRTTPLFPNAGGSVGFRRTDNVLIDLYTWPKPASSKQHTRSDFNDDGIADIMWRSGSTNYIWYMNADGTRSHYKKLGPKSSKYKVAGIADFNNDGIADIMWRSGSTNDIWYMNAAGTRSHYKKLGAKSSKYKVAGIADFNKDRIADIMWRSGSTNYIWYMNADGTRSHYKKLGPKSSKYKVAGIADFNGDGIADIMWRSGSTNYIWYMNANGTRKHYKKLGPKSSKYKVAGIADFNKDGIADIMWRSGSTNYIWFMNDDGTRSHYKKINPKSSSYKAVGVTDYNGDGIADIMWRSGSTNYIWYMNADGTRSHYQKLGTKSSSYRVQQ